MAHIHYIYFTVISPRIHLALKAYQELLMTLDAMDRSGNSTLIESSKVIKSKF